MKGNLCRCTGYRAIKQAITQGVSKPGTATGRVGAAAAAGAATRSAGRSIRRPPSGWSPAPSRTRSTPRFPARCYLRVLGSPHAHARITGIDTAEAEADRRRRTGPDPPECAATPLLHRPAREPAGRSRRHPHARRRHAVRRPAGRRGGRRHGRGRRGGLPPDQGASTTCCQRSSIPNRPGQPGAPILHPELLPADRVLEADRNVIAASMTASAVTRRRARRVCGHRVRHLADPTDFARPARNPRRPRLDRRGRAAGAADQLAGAVPGPRRVVPAAGPAEGQGAGIHQAGRRRVRRQAGDPHRGPGRARGAAYRPPGQLRDEPARRSSSAPRCATRCGSRWTSAPRPTGC